MASIKALADQYDWKRVFVIQNFLWMLGLHVLAIVVAPFFFRWDAFLLAWTFTFVSAYSMGIFHHMMLTHDSFRSKKWIMYLGSLLGTLTWRGPFSGPLKYVAMHVVHHEYSDRERDPHSPIHGLFFSFMGWFWRMSPPFLNEAQYLVFVPERIRHDKVLRFMDRHVHGLQAFWGLLCFTIGCIIEFKSGIRAQLLAGFSFVLYGVFVKSMLVIWMADTVDLINHTIGYRNFETQDHSTNSFIMAAVHLGGAISWHNNHHAQADFFSVKARWWEIDVHYRFLQFLSFMGLVWDIKVLDMRKSEVAQQA